MDKFNIAMKTGFIILWFLGVMAMVGMAYSMALLSYWLLPIPALIFVLWTAFMFLAIKE